MGINCIGISDADKGESPSEKLFSFPGSLAPEQEVYLDKSVQELIDEEYHIDIKKILTINGNLDHHSFGKTFAIEAETTEELLNNFAIKQYIKLKGKDYFQNLMKRITENI